jgi:serine/threonine protein kinase
MNRADYKEICMFRRGATGEVFLCEHKRPGVLVALKKVDGRKDRLNRRLFIREIAIPLKLDLPSIVKLIGFRSSELLPRDCREPRPWVITELMPNGGLHDLLKSKHTGRPTPGFGPTEQSKAVFGVASTMAQIHERSVIHRDLKPSHVSLDANWEIRIGGFHLSRVHGKRMTMAIGSPVFMAPELFVSLPCFWMSDVYDDKYSLPVDVYACGVLLYQFFADKFVLEGMEGPVGGTQELWTAVGKGRRYKRPIGVPDPFWNLITQCWAHDPADRPSFGRIVKLMLESNDFTFPGTDLEKYNEYRQRMTAI